MCLKVASVIGRMFANQLVEQAYPIEHERAYVAARLRNISLAELVDEETQVPELQYLFRHFITRDVTYGIMPGAQRRPLHRAVAKCLESSDGQQTTVFPLLAHHWSEAADGPKAVFYLEKAGHQSMRDGAFREAVIFLSRAIDFMDTGAIKDQPKKTSLVGERPRYRQLFSRRLGGQRATLGTRFVRAASIGAGRCRSNDSG